jgi:TRIAD3 protein (E3 ubiquitin-protein ligase RNF216)
MEKYDEASFLANLQKANIDGLCKCPKCEFSAILPETENIFICPNVHCRFESCRFCGDESHIPLRCSEVEKKSDTDARKSVEEAMANARIRECPTCHKRFFKEEGCNKMTCSCGTKICYVCRVKINDYTHFCQQPHCNHKSATCNKCPLYSNSVEEDKDAVRRAASRATANVPAGSEIAQLNVEKLIQSVSTEHYHNRYF